MLYYVYLLIYLLFWLQLDASLVFPLELLVFADA